MAKVVVDCSNTLGECVLWCERKGRLLWTDVQAATLWACEAGSGWGSPATAPLEAKPTGSTSR